MKVLIIGKNSYIGKKLHDYLSSIKHDVNSISLRNDFDENLLSFANVDVVIHLAALVHRNEKIYSYHEYYEANVLLPLKVAKLCNNYNVKQFIFISTMAVYGNSKKIDINSFPIPISNYGKTKLEAEKLLSTYFINSNTHLSIVRSPVVIGKNAPGNPKLLHKLSKFMFLVPTIKNKKSIIFASTLILHINQIIDGKFDKITHPQMKHLFTTSEIIILIRKYYSKRTKKFALLNLIIYFLSFLPIFKKAFSSQYYDFKSYSNLNELYDYNLDQLFTLYE